MILIGEVLHVFMYFKAQLSFGLDAKKWRLTNWKQKSAKISLQQEWKFFIQLMLIFFLWNMWIFKKMANHQPLFYWARWKSEFGKEEHVFFSAMKCIRKLELLKCMFLVKLIHSLGDNLSWVLWEWVCCDQADQDIKRKVSWCWSNEREFDLMLPYWIKFSTFKSNFTNGKYGFTIKTRFRE